ncbi:MAG: hypothetical protein KGH95_02975, partial [Thaumarchaeota archaeon]|nr:hypothetical protein [Nitrososphaerota archaeon]
MDTYYNLPSDERLKLYLKAEPYLTISDYSKVDKTLQEMSDRQKELERKVVGFEKYLKDNGIAIPE